MVDIAYIALGSNLGDRAANLAIARTRLATLPSSRVLSVSAVEETEPILVVSSQEPSQRLLYLNQMVALETSLTPEQLLDELQAIENAAGRVRDVKWGPRTLDLDIVLFGEEEVRSERLTIPHPELPNRAFWQNELRQIRISV